MKQKTFASGTKPKILHHSLSRASKEHYLLLFITIIYPLRSITKFTPTSMQE